MGSEGRVRMGPSSRLSYRRVVSRSFERHRGGELHVQLLAVIIFRLEADVSSYRRAHPVCASFAFVELLLGCWEKHGNGVAELTKDAAKVPT